MWRRYLIPAVSVIAIGVVLPYLFILAVDPYGVSPIRLVPSDHIVRAQRRLIVPQIARDARFDSFLVGTSTINAIDPEWMEAELGGRFANLSVHGATPYEQMRVLALALRHVPAAKTIVLGLDRAWCSESEPIRYHSEIKLPEWLYDDDQAAQLLVLLNWYTLDLAKRKLMLALGGSNDRTAPNGYHDDLPPDGNWTPDRIRSLAASMKPERPARIDFIQADTVFPPLTLLQHTLAATPTGTRVLAVLMPSFNVAGAANEIEANTLESCKRQVAGTVARAGGVTVDFMRPSPWTSEPERYWDFVHFRQSISRALPGQLGRAIRERPGYVTTLFRVM
jgi:hypothetical protein